jgi:hypothetical protein
MNYRITYMLCLILTISATASFGDQAVGFKKSDQKGSLVYYSGTVILEGDITYSRSREDQEMAGDQVCFSPSKSDGKLIPRENDKRTPWFCFRDSKRTMAMLGISGLLNDPKVCSVTGRATIEISKYVVDRAETTTNDTADLVRVITLSKLTTKGFSSSGQECIQIK